MQFCKDCGAVLNLFGKDDRELCPSCIQHQKPTAPPPPPAPRQEELELLGDAVLSFENGKLVLLSKEGWELWSSSAPVRIDLQTLLARARRIYTIRLRRQKN